MLPGLRFLFVTVVLSVSTLVFGLGAAALLRATHDGFASLSSRHPQEIVFPQQPDTTAPTLALLRTESTVVEDAKPNPTNPLVPSIEVPEPQATVALPEPEQQITTAATRLDEATRPGEKPATLAADNSGQTETSPKAYVTASADAGPSTTIASAESAGNASTASGPLGNEVTLAATSPAPAQVNFTPQKVAALGNQPIAAEAPKIVKKPRPTLKKRLHARRILSPRRMVFRPRPLLPAFSASASQSTFTPLYPGPQIPEGGYSR